MISAAARPYIDASVPVLREHGVRITRTFYANMFAAHPELTNLFNMGNQASGAQQQSLAAAVFAYAANIDNLAALAPIVDRIVHKHASIGITAEHYPIVGEYLLGAIKEVLGDAATPALLSAWEEAYGSLATLFIQAERALYSAAETVPGALRPMRVTARQQESINVDAFTLEAADGLPLADFRPGQYISLAIAFADGRRQLRQYSLSDAPGHGYYRISVKRDVTREGTPDGEVSTWIHEHVIPGSIVQVSHPFGEFAPDTESLDPIVLLSAGVGVTPMISVLRRIMEVHPTRPVVFGYAALNPDHHSHRDDLTAASATMPNLRKAIFYEDLGASPQNAPDIYAGRMRVDQLPRWPRSTTNVYLCGPSGFMHAQWRALVEAGVPATRIHREVFGPELLDFVA